MQLKGKMSEIPKGKQLKITYPLTIVRGFPEIGKADKSHRMTQILTGIEAVIQENSFNTGKDSDRFLHYFILISFIFK